MSIRLKVSVLMTLLLILCGSLLWGQEQRVIAIKAARLIDGTGAPPISNAVVLVRGEKIEAVGTQAQVSIPSGAEVIDLGNDTLLPGLINTHAHFSIRNDNTGIFGILKNGVRHDGQQMTWALRHTRNELLSGTTTVRTTGDAQWIDVYLYEAIRKGTVAGPRIITSGLGLAPTGGHGYVTWMVDGPWEIRKHVRMNLEYGATQMKFGLNDATADSTDYTKEEIEAGVDELHRRGRWATAHASGAYGSSTKITLDAGMNSIEHFAPANDETVAKYKQTGGAISMTWIYSPGTTGLPPEDPGTFHKFVDQKAKNITEVIDWVRQHIKKYKAEHPERYEKTVVRDRDPFQVDLHDIRYGPMVMAGEVKQWHWVGHDNIGKLDRKMISEAINDKIKFFYKAYKEGVTVGIGIDTDAYGCLPLYVELLATPGYGPFTPMEAINVATQGSAKTIGWGDKLGTLEKGKYADIISVKGNPLENLQTLSAPNLLMVNGVDYTGLSFR